MRLWWKIVATIKVQELTGATGSKTYTDNGAGTTTVRLFTADQATNQTTPQITYPIPIPAAGFNYSYWKHVCLDVSGTFTKVDNIRHYSDGAIGWAFGSGGALNRGNRDSGDKGCPDASYMQATGTAGTTGDELGATHTYYSGQTTKTVSVASDTSASPATIDSTGVTTAGKTKGVVLQVKVDTAANGATSGVQTAETLTFKYDVIDWHLNITKIIFKRNIYILLFLYYIFR